MAHPLFTTAQTSGATLRHLNMTLGSYISSSLPGSLDALIFTFSLRNQYIHFLRGKPGGYSEQHPQIPPWPVRKCSLWNPLSLILCPVHCVDWKLPNSNDARLKFPKVDTDALPHVVHLISVKWESVREHNRQQNTKLLSYSVLLFFPWKHCLDDVSIFRYRSISKAAQITNTNTQNMTFKKATSISISSFGVFLVNCANRQKHESSCVKIDP